MQQQESIYKIRGKIMHYAWGGTRFLPDLLGIPNPDQQPFAEYWMGAHPMAPAEILGLDGHQTLFDLIRNNPDQVLSEEVAARFGELPFLFKLQDVKDILSIQVHPSKAEAEKGFDREESGGIPIGAPYRNYKDRNHKPEVMVALSEFWLLHGFRSAEHIERMLEDVPEFNVLLPLYRRDGLQALYQFVMEMDQADANALMAGLVKREIRKRKAGELSREEPGWWVAKLYMDKTEPYDIDRATISLYLFNIVKVLPGEAVFQAAGIPHAYMEGQCVELMANSDNVLRAGLTPKHIDIPELMKHTRFDSIVPDVMKGIPAAAGETMYPCPVPDFGIARIELNAHQGYQHTTRSLEILVITEGGLIVNNRLALKKGETFTAFAGQTYHLEASGPAIAFRAFVPAV
jgi:mannose-6-phosphate isomerase